MKNSTLLSKKLIVILALLISFSSVFAQPGTNIQKLQELSKKFKLKWEQENRAAKTFANRNGIPFRFETDKGILFELQSIKDGKPMYYITENATAAATISTNNLLPGGSSGLNLDGTGITVHEWDGGAVLGTHQEYAGRVVMGDGVTSTHYHSTHVAGTMIASGVDSKAKGMAPNANLRAFDWNSDESEMAEEAADGALFSNHSYGYGRGWVWTNSGWVWYGNTNVSTQEDYLFGFYESQAQDWDQIAYDAPYYLIVKSAGNDRGDGPTNEVYPQDGPYDCISHAGLAKNILTVGAVNDIPGGYSGSSSVVMSYFSSWGPADDGRIKPDIVTNGVSLYSSYNTNNTSYASLSGTSMAAPSATGSLVLLQQYYENLNGTGNYMRAATLKALVIETADEAGPNIGPDYMFGWGLMNTERAALKISEDQNINVIDELVLNNGESYTRTVHSNGTEPIKITICWTELPGDPVSTSLDPIDPMLVNDLDLRLTLGGSTFYSWKLDRNNPASAATNNSENNVDNIEVVYIAALTAGDYTVTVDHDGTLSGGSQAFSIIYDGIVDATPVPPVADFSASSTEIFEGETVNFTDLSTGTPSSWAWTFTGGTPSNSNVQKPVIVYNTAGTYEVSLTATNSVGSDTETKTAYIIVSVHPPAANFSSDITTVIIDESVNFTDESSYSPTSWSWSFAGGTPSTSADQNPVITYNTLGTYEVSLTVTNAGGDDTKTVTGYITVSDGSVTYCDSHGNATNEWIAGVTIGSESNTSNSSGSVGYQEFIGTPTFNLESGSTNSIRLVPDFSPRSKFEYWSVWIDFDGDGDFNDANEQVFTASKKRSTVEGSITIPSELNIKTRMRVSMSRSGIPGSCEIFGLGEVEDYTVQIGEAIPQPPVADFTANKTVVLVGETVSFTDLSTNNPTSWAWTFSGGTPSISSSQNQSVTYNSVGTFDVTLTVGNDEGSDTETKINYITVSEVSTKYCESSGLSTTLEWIESISIDGIINNSYNNGGYFDYTGIKYDLSPGSNYSITLTPGFSGKSQREFWRVWINFNGDTDFDDDGELVFAVNNSKSTVSGNINIPTGLSGTTRMRISMKQGSAPLSCGDFSRGEVEDYTVDFGSGTSSNKSATIQSSAQVSIEKNTEVSFNAYPNPTSDKLYIHFEGWEGKKEIRLFDMTGKNIYLKTVSDKLFEIDVSNYPKGIYLIDVSNGVYRKNKRISIQ